MMEFNQNVTNDARVAVPTPRTEDSNAPVAFIVREIKNTAENLSAVLEYLIQFVVVGGESAVKRSPQPVRIDAECMIDELRAAGYRLDVIQQQVEKLRYLIEGDF